MDRLNYFASFKRQLPHWENQITRALLVLLRYSPGARAVFVEHLRQRQQLGGTPSEWVIPSYLLHEATDVGIETQVASITCAEGGRLTSMLLCAEEAEAPEKVQAVERSAVYDGVFAFGDQVILIENKPNSAPETRQLNPARAEGERFEINPFPVVMRWRELLSAVSLLDSRGDVSGSELMILRDFLDYLHEEAPHLCPYTRLRICGQNMERISSRVRALMEEIAKGAVRYHRGWGYHIRLHEGGALMLRVSAHQETAGSTPSIRIELHPGDSQRQARSLYAGISSSRFTELLEPSSSRSRWKAETNFHYAYRASNVCFPSKGAISVPQYVEYWRENQNRIKQLVRGPNAFQEDIEELQRAGIVGDDGIEQFAREVQSKRYDKLNVCPGISLYYDMDLDQAVADDDVDHRLAGRLRVLIEEVLATWGQQFSPDPNA